MLANIFIEKSKIFILYKYYLLGSESFLDWLEQEKKIALKERKKARIKKIDWFYNCLEREEKLIFSIQSKLKEGWYFEYLPPLEKAILIYSIHEILFDQKLPFPSFISQIIDFSKKYLEPSKYSYINKILDSLFN